MKKLFFTLCLILFTAGMSIILAQSPQAALSVQGVLRNSNGTAVANGEYAITFSLWKDSTSTAQADWVWSETINRVPVDGGIYSVVLGDNPNQPLDAPFDVPYYLGVRVGGGHELIPRGRLTYSPYALALIGTDNKFAHTGNVGIGTIDPDNMLTITAGSGSLGIDTDTDGMATTINATANGLEFNSAGNSAHIFSGDNGEVLRIQTDNKIGIGTDDPQSDLHVKASDAIISIEGTNAAGIDFLKSGIGGNLGYNSTDGNDLVLSNTIGRSGLKTSNGGSMMLEESKNELSFFADGTTAARRGFLGYDDGNTNPNNLKFVNEATGGDVKIGANDGIVEFISEVKIGKTPYTLNSGKFIGSDDNNSGLWINWVGHESGFNHNRQISLRATGEILAPMFILSSDARIKENKKVSDAKNDLTVLNQLEVTDYKHIDRMAHGSEVKKGFIAQQVKTVFPEAICMTKDFIPNVYSPSTSVNVENDQLIIALGKNHEFALGDKVKIVDIDEVIISLVTEVIDDKTFAIANEYELDKNVIVYGKEVDDFHTVDYDRIYTLSVSAVQELTRRVAALELENKNLKIQADESSASNLKMNTELTALNKRLQDLESLFESTSNK